MTSILFKLTKTNISLSGIFGRKSIQKHLNRIKFEWLWLKVLINISSYNKKHAWIDRLLFWFVFLLIIPKNGSHYTFHFSTRYVNRCPKKKTKKNKLVFRHYFVWLNIYGSIYKIILNFLFERTHTFLCDEGIIRILFLVYAFDSVLVKQTCCFLLRWFCSRTLKKNNNSRTKYMWETKNHTHRTNFSLRTEY